MVILKEISFVLRSTYAHALRIDIARADRVDADFVDTELACHRACHLKDSRLASVIRDPMLVLLRFMRTRMKDFVGEKRTLFAMLPLMLPIIIMLPGFSNLRICLPAACALKRTPSTFTRIS